MKIILIKVVMAVFISLAFALAGCGGTGTKANTAPVAKAGTDQTVLSGTLVTLEGSTSSDADGDPLTYSWIFTSKPVGSGVSLSSSTVAKPTFTPDYVGVYVLNLVVNDGKVNSTASTVTVTATNAVPVANAGSAQNVYTGNLITLDGSASSDANGEQITYNWIFTSVPTGSVATLSSTTTVKPTFTADVVGVYVLNLVVNDGKVNSSISSVTITADAPSLVLMRGWVDNGFHTSDILDMPYLVNTAFTNTTFFGPIYQFDLNSYRLTANGANYTITNISAIDSTGKVVPYFLNSSNGQKIINNQTIQAGTNFDFSIGTPLTGGNTVILSYKFTIAETGKTFIYNVDVMTN